MLNLVQHLTEYLSFKSKILKRQSPQVKQVVLCNSGTMRSILEGLLTSQAPPLQAWRDQSPERAPPIHGVGVGLVGLMLRLTDKPHPSAAARLLPSPKEEG
jgi:hypothetical protein